MRQQLGGAVAVKSGTAGQTLVSKAEAERRKLIDQAKADLVAEEQAIKVPAEVAEVVASKAKKAAKKATRKSPGASVATAGQQFTEINYQGTLKGTDYMWGVHVAGCADIEKEIKRQFGKQQAKGNSQYVLTNHTATSLRDLLDKIVDGETRELGYHDDNVKVHNCVEKALKASKKAEPAAAPVLTVVQGQKQCPTCKLVKDLDQFNSDKSNPTGVYYACRACGVIARERQKANREAKAAAELQAAATEQPKAKKAKRTK